MRVVVLHNLRFVRSRATTEIELAQPSILQAMWFAAVFYFLLFTPSVMLGFVWHKLFSLHGNKVGVAIAALASVSYVYLVAALLFRSMLLGQDYSNRLFITVEANAALAFCLSILAGVRKSPVRVLLACTAFTISLAWFLVWAVNAAV